MEQAGQQLWNRCLSDVIILTENVRQTDVAYAESLERYDTRFISYKTEINVFMFPLYNTK